MKKTLLAPVLPLLLLFFAFPSPSLAFVEVGAGFGITSFEDDLEEVDTGAGTSLEVNIGTGVMRLMFALHSSDHDEGDYSSWMIGPSWTLADMGFVPRIYALVSQHEFEDVDGWGVTAGGGLGWNVFPSAIFGLDLRLSRWEGDDADVETGTLQVMFRFMF